MVTIVGAISGMAIGIILCLLQIRYGWLTLDLAAELQPYPVTIKATDVAVVILLVLAVGYLAAVYPVRKLISAHETTSK